MKIQNAALMCAAALVVLPHSTHAADKTPTLVTYPASKDLQASVTLLKREGSVGKSTPFFTGYRPQHQFSGGGASVTCAIQIPKPKEQVEPGETTDVVINCAEKFNVIEGQLGFMVFEGGRKVAEGTLR
jgi:translation elongation factor EF-Tu-like GTPase